MPKPVASGDVTDAEIEHDDGSVSSREGSVKVNLEEKETKPASSPADGKVETTPATPPDRSAEERRWKALESQVAATRRINEDLKRQNEDVRRQLSTLNERLTPATTPASQGDSGARVLPAGTTQETIDKYDKLVTENRWQDAVRLLAREEARAEYRTTREIENATEQVRRVEERRLTALERSKAKVESAYPTLHRDTGNPDSVETQLFNEAVAELSTEDEEFIHSPHSPELAMRRMEELAQARSITLAKSVTRSAPASSPRRPGQTSLPVSRGAGGATTYTLTPDQKVFADTAYPHLPESERYKHYARFAKGVETTGGADA